MAELCVKCEYERKPEFTILIHSDYIYFRHPGLVSFIIIRGTPDDSDGRKMLHYNIEIQWAKHVPRENTDPCVGLYLGFPMKKCLYGVFVWRGVDTAGTVIHHHSRKLRWYNSSSRPTISSVQCKPARPVCLSWRFNEPHDNGGNLWSWSFYLHQRGMFGHSQTVHWSRSRGWSSSSGRSRIYRQFPSSIKKIKSKGCPNWS